jgi:hypothetical protein
MEGGRGTAGGGHGKIKVHVLGEEHPDTLTHMENLALTYEAQGQWKEAEALQVVIEKAEDSSKIHQKMSNRSTPTHPLVWHARHRVNGSRLVLTNILKFKWCQSLVNTYVTQLKGHCIA